jgi:hypothetical protein
MRILAIPSMEPMALMEAPLTGLVIQLADGTTIAEAEHTSTRSRRVRWGCLGGLDTPQHDTEARQVGGVAREHPIV